jgi:elongation factor 1-alpha
MSQTSEPGMLRCSNCRRMQEAKNHFYVIVLGNLDAGKSTTTGHFLYLLGEIDDERIERFENESREMMRETFKYAWVLDELKAEREQGLTIDLSRWNFESSRFSFTIIDAPGHRNFLKNLITGISEANIGFLVVDASPGGFEIGYEGATKEHLMLGDTFGLKQLIIGINKMDCCEYSESRYNEIQDELKYHLLEIGYHTQNIFFVPISGWFGDNLIERSIHMPWYHGRTLVEAFDSLNPPIRFVDRPLRLPVQDVYHVGGIGTVSVGRVATGTLREGMRIIFSPSGLESEVRSFEMRRGGLTEAFPGDQIGFHSPNIERDEVTPGEIVSDPLAHPAHSCDSFQGQMIIISHPGSIRNGYSSLLRIHTATVMTKWKNIDAKLHRRTGELIEENPLFVRSGDVCLVTLEPSKPLVVEEYSIFPPLGRFVMRDCRRTVAVGVVKSFDKTIEPLIGKGAKKKH